MIEATTVSALARYLKDLLESNLTLTNLWVEGEISNLTRSQRGNVQLIVDFVQPAGVGARQAEFERLKEKLAADGLFDEARKRPLPAFPERIGVVTSPTGAVFHDISNVVARR